MHESSAGVSQHQAVMPTGGYLEVVRGYGSPEDWGPSAQASAPSVELHVMLGVATEAYPAQVSSPDGDIDFIDAPLPRPVAHDEEERIPQVYNIASDTEGLGSPSGAGPVGSNHAPQQDAEMPAPGT